MSGRGKGGKGLGSARAEARFAAVMMVRKTRNAHLRSLGVDPKEYDARREREEKEWMEVLRMATKERKAGVDDGAHEAEASWVMVDVESRLEQREWMPLRRKKMLRRVLVEYKKAVEGK